ncbi:MAG: thiamine phosphate synthase [Oscillospiraceae bacterium]|nr:thiamine phosphate synthase [Oscillospiraceae bacterium]
MLICVSDRSLCQTYGTLSPQESYFRRICRICSEKPDGIIIREKDMDEDAYEQLLCSLISQSGNESKLLIANKYTMAARNAGITRIQLSFNDFMNNRDRTQGFACIGVSVHSCDEAVTAYANGASYLIYGHIFNTQCKKGVPPRGIQSLKNICLKVKIPVFAIGGITEKNAASVIGAGAAGVCVMSGLMCCAEDELSDKISFFKSLGNANSKFIYNMEK